MAPRIMQRGPPPISAAPSRITPIIHLTYICRIFLPPFISAALFEVSLFSQAGVPFAFSCFFFLSVSYRKGGCRAQMSANGIFLSANGSVSVQLAEIPKEKDAVSQIPCQTAPCLILPLSHSPFISFPFFLLFFLSAGSDLFAGQGGYRTENAIFSRNAHRSVVLFCCVLRAF